MQGIESWSTVLIAGLGIAGTLLAPLLSERMRRRSVRQERLLAERMGVYADLLRAAARIAENSKRWASDPGLELQMTDDEELNIMQARLQVVGSKKVHKEYESFFVSVQLFNFKLAQARLGDSELIDRPMLHQGAGRIKKHYLDLVQLIREETSS